MSIIPALKPQQQWNFRLNHNFYCVAECIGIPTSPVCFQAAGRTRRGPTAGRRWLEMAGARPSLSTPSWWQRRAARSSPAGWRTTAAPTSWTRCRRDDLAHPTPVKLQWTGPDADGTVPLARSLAQSHTRTSEHCRVVATGGVSSFSKLWTNGSLNRIKYLNVSYVSYESFIG